jgi:hypothetical protein
LQCRSSWSPVLCGYDKGIDEVSGPPQPSLVDPLATQNSARLKYAGQTQHDLFGEPWVVAVVLALFWCSFAARWWLVAFSNNTGKGPSHRREPLFPTTKDNPFQQT